MEAVDRRVEEELERRRDEIEEEVGSAANFATLAFAVKLIFQTDQFGFEIRPQSAGNGTQSNFVFMGQGPTATPNSMVTITLLPKGFKFSTLVILMCSCPYFITASYTRSAHQVARRVEAAKQEMEAVMMAELETMRTRHLAEETKREVGCVHIGRKSRYIDVHLRI